MGDAPADKVPGAGRNTDPDSVQTGDVTLSGRSPRAPDGDMRLGDLWQVVWEGRRLVIGLTAAFAIASVAYALLATSWYRSEVLLSPVDQQSMSSLAGQLGGLAALAGINLAGSGNRAEPLAVARSREFAEAFIRDHHLIPVFFADDWDAEKGTWRGTDPKKWPDIRSAVKFFHDEVLDVNEDPKTGLVTLAVEWKDPDVAAAWANELVTRLNARLRARALREAEANVTYLEGELTKTSVVTLQQSVGRLLEGELQKLMLARGREEFAFRVIDKAEPPRKRVRPKRVLVVVLGTIVGGLCAIFWLFLARELRSATAGARRR